MCHCHPLDDKNYHDLMLHIQLLKLTIECLICSDSFPSPEKIAKKQPKPLPQGNYILYTQQIFAGKNSNRKQDNREQKKTKSRS